VDTDDRDTPEARRIRELQAALGLTQVEMAERTVRASAESGGMTEVLTQPEISKLRKGRMSPSTERIRGALCAAFQIDREQLALYLFGRLALPDLLAARSARLAAAPGPLTFRRLPTWPALVAEAQRIRPHLRPETFEVLADSPIAWGSPESVTAYLLADLADVVQRHRDADDVARKAQ
jgi:transcriptional regulator with XRE-family HTH domain